MQIYNSPSIGSKDSINQVSSTRSLLGNNNKFYYNYPPTDNSDTETIFTTNGKYDPR